ncbi:MAG: HlyC/CorC family transporter [Ruminococcaceae bacterium]|nr:HlyC/CorC family transporter [Oscillospiraceae bacterium]
MLLFQLALIACNAIFACAEIAVISMNESRLEKLADEGDKRAKRLSKLTENPAKFLATIQVAITLAGFLGSAFAAENFSGPIVDWLVSLGVTIPEKTLDTLAVIVITLILSYVTLILGELVPKRVAQRKAESIALAISGLVCGIAKLFAPIVWLLTVSTNGVLRLLGIDPNAEENDVSEEDIHDVVDSAVKSGSIDDEERDFIQNVFEFDDLTAGDVSTHRTDVEVLWLDETDDEWAAIIHESCHMFYPVCGESADDVVGVLYLKDYFRLDERSREAVMEKAVKTPYFVPESVKADVLFRNMKSGGKSFAVVLDEYGGMHGILTMNDLISRLIGDFGGEDSPESGKPAVSLEKMEDGSWRLTGNMEISDIAEELDVELPVDDFDTFSGMVFAELGAIPDDGETFSLTAWGLNIEVTEVRDHQVSAAKITVIAPAESEEDDDDDDDDE